jgi:hypothetical protein
MSHAVRRVPSKNRALDHPAPVIFGGLNAAVRE